jgi:hypothetical protein
MAMEDDTRAFLVLIVNTMSLVLLWMMANVFFGIYIGYGFFEGSPSWENLLYYALAISSLVLILMRIKRKWNI